MGAEVRTAGDTDVLLISLFGIQQRRLGIFICEQVRIQVR